MNQCTAVLLQHSPDTCRLVPGKLVGYVPVYFLLTVGTGIAFAIYAVFALVHWKELLILQGK